MTISPMGTTVLIVDDDPTIQRSLSRGLTRDGYAVETAGTIRDGLELLAQKTIDLVLLDLHLPDGDGLGFLASKNDAGHNQPVVMISGEATIESAVKAVQLGALDFVSKPVELGRVLVTLRNALRLERLTEVQIASDADNASELLGSSPAMQRLRALIDKAAPSEARVLITGANGTGKELVARAIRAGSRRRDQPFAKLNCAAVPHDLIESELFGHEKGAFTGAVGRRRGKFELAHGGILFLDEVGEMPLAMQPKLLRVLQEGELERIGGSQTLTVDVRVVAATNRDLTAMIAAGKFREDLYYRLNVFQIETPSLRQRPEDIGELAQPFLTLAGRKNGRPGLRLEPAALSALSGHDYPGNVRELQNICERLAILAEGDTIAAAEVLAVLPGGVRPEIQAGPPPVTLYRPGAPFKDLVDEAQREIIRAALLVHDSNMSATARALDLERSHLYKKCRGLGIKPGG